ncbi:flagellar filament capping protein FliD [Trinickia fusca]|uniref:Flagellar hook-associated protein 2 n=1 Tax=Trinickia fusca TaxID=2419777 RepID=A0A494XVY7_9BURK|nr:flagellar filament capping protein FliD [Trinickia fusca]RKP52254.1 flagellar hook protein FliD [Trinickia fusca]
MGTVSPSSNTTLLQQAAQSIVSGATGSSLDVNTLVSAIVMAKIAGRASAIANQQKSGNTMLSALGMMKSSLGTLQTSLAGLSDGSIFTQFAATASGKGITATTTGGAAAGSYAVNVQQLATANQISSKAFAAKATLGTGTLTIGIGSASMTLNLDSKNNTLAGIASAINGAANNPGVTAAVVTGTDGQHLVLTSAQTGAANIVSVSAGAGVDSNMATANFTQVEAAQDAKLTISGSAVTSASNTVKDALTGVTLNLTSAAVGSPQTISVAADPSAIALAVQGFQKAYNAWVAQHKSLSSYDPSTAQAGPLLGDAMLNSAVNGIGGIMASGVAQGGKTYSLAQIGLDLKHDGTLGFDQAKLQSTLSANPTLVSSVFNGTNGIGQQMNKFLDAYTQTTIGQVDKRTASINSSLLTVSKQQNELVAYQQTLTTQYNAQFTALNRLLTRVNNNRNYLNQLFGGNGSPGTMNKSA